MFKFLRKNSKNEGVFSKNGVKNAKNRPKKCQKMAKSEKSYVNPIFKRNTLQTLATTGLKGGQPTVTLGKVKCNKV